MVKHHLNVLAATAALSLAVASQAGAGCCQVLYTNCGCGPVVEQVLVPPTEMYLVNQGPNFSGPGHDLPRQAPDVPDVQPGGYPYVGFVYSGYPYGLQNSGGYARGYYDPAIGYPYAEPMPRRAVRRYVSERVMYRVNDRPARVYQRNVGPRIMPVPRPR